MALEGTMPSIISDLEDYVLEEQDTIQARTSDLERTEIPPAQTLRLNHALPLRGPMATKKLPL